MTGSDALHDDPIALGLRWLLARDGRADEATIHTQLELAVDPWVNARDTLHADPLLVVMLDDLWPRVLPYLIKGSHVSPVHHIAYVVQHMALIAVGEGLNVTDTRRCVLAALFHDIGIGDATRPKISEFAVQNERDPVKQQTLREEAIASRLEHMILGDEITATLLADYRTQQAPPLTDADVAVIRDIVRTHDNSKIPLLQTPPEPQWFLDLTPTAWLKQCHWEADALWMLCPQGLLVDIARRGAAPTPAEHQTQFVFNEQLHRDIVTLYAQVFDATTFAAYGFRDGLLYRTATGYALARQFRELQGLPT